MVINDEFKGCSTQMRAERERLGYSREQIAERAHISPRYLAAIELGEKIPKADVMVRIIRAMGASADAIFYGPLFGPGENRHFGPGENSQFWPDENRQSVPEWCSQPRFRCEF